MWCINLFLPKQLYSYFLQVRQFQGCFASAELTFYCSLWFWKSLNIFFLIANTTLLLSVLFLMHIHDSWVVNMEGRSWCWSVHLSHLPLSSTLSVKGKSTPVIDLCPLCAAARCDFLTGRVMLFVQRTKGLKGKVLSHFFVCLSCRKRVVPLVSAHPCWWKSNG